MSHGDAVTEIPADFIRTGTSADCPFASIENPDKKIYGIQFHPEVRHSVHGYDILRNFALNICGAKGDWTMDNFIDMQIKKIRETVGDKRVLLGLSGGVDSSVVGVLLQKAIGDQLICIFVDHGLLRKGKPIKLWRCLVASLVSISSKQTLQNVSLINWLVYLIPEKNGRSLVTSLFMSLMTSKQTKRCEILGTRNSSTLTSSNLVPILLKLSKSHHNVGGLPEDMQFELIEPLNTLYKDEVRAAWYRAWYARPHRMAPTIPRSRSCHPCYGEITEEKLETVRESDAILREEIAKAGLDRDIWQYFTVNTGVRSVGVMGTVVLTTIRLPFVLSLLSME